MNRPAIDLSTLRKALGLALLAALDAAQ